MLHGLEAQVCSPFTVWAQTVELDSKSIRQKKKNLRPRKIMANFPPMSGLFRRGCVARKVAQGGIGLKVWEKLLKMPISRWGEKFCACQVVSGRCRRKADSYDDRQIRESTDGDGTGLSAPFAATSKTENKSALDRLNLASIGASIKPKTPEATMLGCAGPAKKQG